MLAFFAFTLPLVFPLAAQKHFSRGEKATVEKFRCAKVHFEKGLDFLKNGDPAKAQKEAAACLEIFPGYADGHLLLALLRYQQGNFATALKEIETAKAGFGAIKEFHAASYRDHFARLREQREQTAERLAELVNSGGSQMLISDARHSLALKDEELRNWKPAVARAMPAEYHFVHGDILGKLQRLDEAQGFYQAALLADPHHANAYANLIGICLLRGDKASARKYLRQAEGNGVTVNATLKEAVLKRR